MVPPLAVDIDGTLTRPDTSIDPRVIDPLRDWDAPVVVATGKAFPYPVALCAFLGIPTNVVAETYRESGRDLGWGAVDPVNRWRETELAVARDRPLAPLERVAADHGMQVVDTGYAYHAKSPAVDKGEGLETAAGLLGLSAESFVAVGDSENDAAAFDLAGRSFAVANADDAALTAADEVTEAAFADGFLEALSAVRNQG